MNLDPGDIVLVDRLPGFVFVVFEPETVPDEDTWWSGYEVETGRFVLRGIGDDQRYIVDLDECTPAADGTYCRSCGATGCGWDPSEG